MSSHASLTDDASQATESVIAVVTVLMAATRETAVKHLCFCFHFFMIMTIIMVGVVLCQCQISFLSQRKYYLQDENNYFVWNEGMLRLFENNSRAVAELPRHYVPRIIMFVYKPYSEQVLSRAISHHRFVFNQ